MFLALQTEISDRFTAVKQYFSQYPRQQSEIAQTAKGLVFVQVYAIYEYTLRTGTRRAIAEIVSHGHSFASLTPTLQALFLDAELKSLRDVPEKKIWASRIALLERALSPEPILWVDALPHDGNYFRYTQLQMTFDVLGIKKPITTRKRYKTNINEVVDNRNSIAHGHETPAEVGRRYSYADVRKQVETMERICLRIVTVLAEHCSDTARHCR